MGSRYTEHKIKASKVQSLVWEDDELVDWVGGGVRFSLDGSTQSHVVNYAYKFDAAISSPSGQFVVLYTRTGTTGLLLRRGEIVRQLTRDFYQAHAYEYPIAFGTASDGRELLVHCPESYCQIEIEDAESGERVKSPSKREPGDCFHSRLACSPNGRLLLSAGWVWHPLDVIGVFDLPAALSDPTTLDKSSLSPPGSWELSSASFVNDDYLMVGSSEEFYGDEDDEEDDQPGKHQIALWRIGASDYTRRIALSYPPGTICPINERFVVSFYQHPRLIDLEKSETVLEWPHIKSGSQTSSIVWDKHPPPMAFDPKNYRFAIANEDSITVIEIDISSLTI